MIEGKDAKANSAAANLVRAKATARAEVMDKAAMDSATGAEAVASLAKGTILQRITMATVRVVKRKLNVQATPQVASAEITATATR